MCGIVGILHRDSQKTVDVDLLTRMSEIISHRGPDDEGLFLSGPVGLGHRRLAVIDLVSGHQPMMTLNDEGRVIVYNGEIYNYRELRHNMVEAGFTFKTDCDTEVLLNLANLSSLDWLEQVNGMFAFALWEESSKTLLLGRDRFGIKPLYYTDLGDEFLFASEIKPLLLHPKVQREVNFERIPEYLAFRCVCGNETMFKGIFELLPGHVMVLSQKDYQPKIVKFWEDKANKNNFDFTNQDGSFEDQFKEIFLNSVKHRLISDVPVGTYNSGGVDSSLVTAVVRSVTQGELHTFSVGFEEESFDERKYSQIIADRLGTHHHTLVINEKQYVDSLQEALWYLEEPINHAHTVHLLHLSRLAKKYVTVVLTGEGADEVFAGYPRYQIPLLTKYLTYLPKIISKGFLSLSQSFGKHKLIKLFENSHNLRQSVVENARFVPKDDFKLLFPALHNDFVERYTAYKDATNEQTNFLDNILSFDRKTYLPALLNRLDKVSMAAAVETRVAYLDHRLVEWSSLLPQNMKVKIARNCKVIVKKVAEQWLPKEIIYRKKSGFGVPLSTWFRNSKGLGQYLDILTDKTFQQRGYFDGTSVEKLIREHLSGAMDHNEILWGLLSLELWCRNFIDHGPFNKTRP